MVVLQENLNSCGFWAAFSLMKFLFGAFEKRIHMGRQRRRRRLSKEGHGQAECQENEKKERHGDEAVSAGNPDGPAAAGHQPAQFVLETIIVDFVA